MFSKFLALSTATQTDSIQSYVYQDQKVWLKKASKRHSTWIYFPLRIMSRLLGLHMLAPVPNYGGAEAIACEIARLRQLRYLGIQVPEILAFDQHSFLLKDAAIVGSEAIHLEHALLRKEQTTERLALYAQAIHAIQQVHLKGAYLSEAFARNILVDDAQNLSFIDFETDPGQVLSLTDCQTRDWLCFIFSTANCFETEEVEQAKQLLVSVLENEPKSFLDICRVGRKLKWILNLNPESFGNDGRRLGKCIYLLNALELEKPLPMI